VGAHSRIFGHAGLRAANHGFVRSPFLAWALIIVLGGLVEETWRATTLNASFQAGFNASAALIATSAAFVFCHVLGTPGRNQGLQEEVFWEFGVGLALGGLFTVSRTPLVPIFVNILYHSLNLTLIRSEQLRRKTKSLNAPVT
jgi:hypothetical protein